MMVRLASIIFLTFVLAVSAFSQFSLKVGSVAPVFTATALDGIDYDLSELRGNVVVITFWSTTCIICQHEIPRLNPIAERFGQRKVFFLALTMEDENKIAGFLQHNPFKFEVLPNSFGVLLQYADRDKKGNIQMGFPSFFVIDREGLVRYRSSGYDKARELESRVSQLLAAE
jgi:peroxiredoxin